MPAAHKFTCPVLIGFMVQRDGEFWLSSFSSWKLATHLAVHFGGAVAWDAGHGSFLEALCSADPKFIVIVFISILYF